MNPPAVALPSTLIAGSERLVVVVGASGAGKDSLMRAWRTAAGDALLHVAQRVITREPDVHEAHEAATAPLFERLRSEGILLTWWHAHGLSYGIRASELAPLQHGRWVALNGSREHLPRLRAQAPGLHVVEVVADPALVAGRLARRGRETGSGLEARRARQVGMPVAADLVLTNDGTLDAALASLLAWWRGLAGGS